MPRVQRKIKHSAAITDLPHLDEAGLVAKVKKSDNALLLILDGVQDPHNLGACLRTAAAAGCLAVVIPKDRAAPMTDTVIQVSCGGAGAVPLVRVTNLAPAMRNLQEAGLWIAGTSDAAEKSLYEADLSGKLGLVMGAEGTGLRRLTEEHCDFLLTIPMAVSPVDCLNVSVASGVCLFEALRQRG